MNGFAGTRDQDMADPVLVATSKPSPAGTGGVGYSIESILAGGPASRRRHPVAPAAPAATTAAVASGLDLSRIIRQTMAGHQGDLTTLMNCKGNTI